MKKLLLSFTFSLAFIFILFIPVSASDAVLNVGQTIKTSILIDIVYELDNAIPNWNIDYYYSVQYHNSSFINIILFPKNNNPFILAKNNVDSDLSTIDEFRIDYYSTIYKLKYAVYSIYNGTISTGIMDSYSIILNNKSFYINLPVYVYYSYYSNINSTDLYPLDPTIFGYFSIPSNILNGNFNEFDSGSFFDFIVSFDNWLSKSLNDLIYTDPYLADYGSVYDYKQNGFIKFGVYLLFVIAFVVTLTFVLGFVKSAYYFVKEIF